jgi:tetratricopeptide (TPR) repeat protein
MRLSTIILACCVSFPALSSRADDIVVKNGVGAPGRIIENARIRGISEGQLRYITSAGGERSEQVERIFQLRPTADPALTAAEEAFVTGRWDEAIDHYQRVVRGAEEWKRRWSAPRLLEAARRGKRFDAEVSAYIAFVKIDASSASTLKPDPAGVGASLVDDALTELDRALRGADAQQSASLLALKLELQRARGDTEGALRTLDDLLRFADSFEVDTGMRRIIADARLAQATAALEAGDHARSIDVIRKASSSFVEPGARARAIFITAQAREGLAQASDDRRFWLDAALEYMQLVALFDEQASGGLRSRALARIADIHERLGETDAARSIWKDLIEHHPQTPSGVLAQQRLGSQP